MLAIIGVTLWVEVPVTKDGYDGVHEAHDKLRSLEKEVNGFKVNEYDIGTDYDEVFEDEVFEE